VLARTLEAAGLSTVTITMMPGYAVAVGIPRVVGVEFPFGHPIGMPGDPAMQLIVLRAALRLFHEARAPGSRLDVDIEWPVEQSVAYKAWQPREPSPIVAWFKEQILARRAGETS
jgi:hypothetical protein